MSSRIRTVSGSTNTRMSIVAMALLLTFLFLAEGHATEVSPSALTFTAVQGGSNPASQTVTVSKNNKRSLKWTVTDNATWLNVSPSSGTLVTTSQLSVGVNVAGLATGTYTATVTMKVDKGGNASIPVTVIVEPTKPPTAKSVTLAWNPNPEPDLLGYKVYVSTVSGSYGTGLPVGTVTTYTLTDLQMGNTYYFVVTAYDQNGNESLFSNEVSTSLY